MKSRTRGRTGPRRFGRGRDCRPSTPTGETPPIPSSEPPQVVLTYLVAPTLRPSMNSSIFPAAASKVPQRGASRRAGRPTQAVPLLPVVGRVADPAGLHVALQDVIGPGTGAVEPEDRAVAVGLFFRGKPDPSLQRPGLIAKAGFIDGHHVAAAVELQGPAESALPATRGDGLGGPGLTTQAPSVSGR